MWRLDFRLFLLRRHTNVLHITAPKDDVFVDGGRLRKLFAGFAAPSFGAVRDDIFEGNGRSLWIDFMQCSDVAIYSLIQSVRMGWRRGGYIPNIAFRDQVEPLTSFVNQMTRGENKKEGGKKKADSPYQMVHVHFGRKARKGAGEKR